MKRGDPWISFPSNHSSRPSTVHQQLSTQTTTYSSLCTERCRDKNNFPTTFAKMNLILFIHLVCPTMHCWKLFCPSTSYIFLHLSPPLSTSHGPLCWPSQKLSTICWTSVVFLFVYIFPVLPYICLQSLTLVCPESSSPAHSLASLRKPECFSSCNSNSILRFASTITTTTSTQHNLMTRSCNSCRNDYWFSEKNYSIPYIKQLERIQFSQQQLFY